MGLFSSSIELTEGQSLALDRAKAWFAAGPNGKTMVFRLFGYAGTGKTSIAPILARELGIAHRTMYAAYTGKAVSVLRSKGIEASTIHKLIYIPREKSRARLAELEAALAQAERSNDRDEVKWLRAEIRAERSRLRSPDFVVDPASPLRNAKLLVLDEVSMVGEQMAADLLSFGVPVLVLGDPAQLPPVQGEGYFMRDEPDALLTEVVRTGGDSPVLNLSMQVRAAIERGDRSLGVDPHRVEPLTIDQALAYDQTIVRTNRSRWKMIHGLRGARGCPAGVPVVGDRVIVLRNDAARNVYNGQQLTVRGVGRQRKADITLDVEASDDEGEVFVLPALLGGFLDHEGEENARDLAGKGRGVALTFADAITAHKAQGSEWPHVLVMDESNGLYGMTFAQSMQSPDADRRRAHRRAVEESGRWLYTAVTRATSSVVIARGVRGVVETPAKAQPPSVAAAQGTIADLVVDMRTLIDRETTVEGLRRLWRMNRAIFEYEPEMLAYWKARGRQLEGESREAA